MTEAQKKVMALRMKPGEQSRFPVGAPEIMFVACGKLSYVWVGDGQCFATISGAATLRKLARAILAEVGER